MVLKADKIVVLITASNTEEAANISNLLLEKRKVACCSTVSSVHSAFWWQGKLENEKESLLICKTKRAALPALIELVKSVHSYDVPEIIALPVIGGSEDYLRWLDGEVGLHNGPGRVP